MAEGKAFALCVARFYDELADRLEAGARAALPDDAEIEVFTVPGAFELPLAAKYAVESGRFEGVVCLGAVIRGETDHYDWVCQQASQGIQMVQLASGIPVGFGVLTVDTYEQALERSGDGKRDTGRHAAEAVLANLAIKESFKGRRQPAGFGP
jgi:6,7-dimethyl-8-ribityllumazine synthase